MGDHGDGVRNGLLVEAGPLQRTNSEVRDSSEMVG